jgi:serine/threonine-protein phosphatase 6 regulatory ankyrin repeat subunit B
MNLSINVGYSTESGTYDSELRTIDSIETPFKTESVYNCAAIGRADLISDLISSPTFPIELVDFIGKDGKSPIIIAIEKGFNMDVVKLLLSYNADVNVGGNALYHACEYNQSKIVKILLEHSTVDINHQSYYNNYTPIMYASCQGYIDIVQTIIEHGPDINISTSNGMTALMLACSSQYHGSDEIVSMLLAYGTSNALHKLDINAMNTYKATALHLACKSKHKDIIHTLLNHGVNVNMKDHVGFTPIAITCKCGGNLEIAKLLIEYGADVNIRDREGYSVLCIACRYKELEMVILFLTLCYSTINLNLQTNSGYTA